MNTELLETRIARITIKDTVSGSDAAGDHFGFGAQQTDKLKIGTRALTILHSQPASMNIELLEARIAPASIVFDAPSADGSPDFLTLSRSGPLLVLSLNSSQVAAWEFASLDALLVRGSADDDTLVLDFDSGELIPAGGLSFDGAAGFDALDLHGGVFAEEVHTAFDAHSGTIALDGRLISYAGIEPINDTTAAASLTLSGTAGIDTMVLTNGGLVGGVQTILLQSVDEPPRFESVRFGNKTNVIIQGLGGADTMAFNATIASAGLQSLTLHGHSATNAGDDNATDTISINTSLSGVAFTLTGGGGSDLLEVSGGSFNRTVTLDGQAGNDSALVSAITISGTPAGAGLSATSIASFSVGGASFTNNADAGLELSAMGAVSFSAVTATGNAVGVRLTTGASFSDTDSVFSTNADHGIHLIDIAGDVTLVRTTADNNDADNDNLGDGLNASDGVDAGGIAIGGNLLVQGARFRDSGAAVHQERGVFVQSLAAASTVTFEDSTGVVQSNILTGNESAAVSIQDGGSSATFTGGAYSNNFNGIVLISFGTINATGVTANGSTTFRGLSVSGAENVNVNGGDFSGNNSSGLELFAVSGSVTLSGVNLTGNNDGIRLQSVGTFSDTGSNISNNRNHGIQLIDITGDVTLARTTADNNDANNDGTGDGLNATDGGDADAFAIGGALLVQGARFRDSGGASDHQERGVFIQSIAGAVTFEDSTGIVQSVVVTGNEADGVLINDGGAGITFTGGTFSNNGDDGIDLNSFNAVTLTNVVIDGNPSDGLEIGFSGSLAVSGGSMSGNGDDGLDAFAITGAVSVIGGSFVGNGAEGIDINDTGSVQFDGVSLSGNSASTLTDVAAVTLTPTTDATDDSVLITATEIRPLAGGGDAIVYTNVGALTVNLGEGNDTVRVTALGAGMTALTLNGGDGKDTFHVAGSPTAAIQVDGGAPATALGDQLFYDTAGGADAALGAGTITQPGFQPLTFTGIEATALVNRTLRLLNATTAIYIDTDGDTVKISSTKPLALADFTLAFNADFTGAQLQTVNLAGKSGFTGANITVTAKRSTLGGDGFANIGFIDADGTNLGTVKIKGDLGRIDAGTGSAAVPAIKSLTVQSLGRLEDLTQAPGGTLASNILGKLGKLTVFSDVRGTLNVAGTDFASGADGKIGPIVIGGSLDGTDLLGTGFISATGNIASVKIAGSILGGDALGSGVIASGGSIGPVKIGGSIVGGAGATSGAISAGSSLPIPHHIASVTIGGDLRGGAGDFSGTITTIGGGRIGNVTIGGSLIAGDNPLNGIQSDTTLGAVMIKGDVRGTAAVPAIIAAQGVFNPATPAQSLAIKSLTVGGRVERAEVLAGFKTLVTATLPVVVVELVATNPDVQIGRVNVGTWIASSLSAGVTAGADDIFGTADDALATPFILGVEDDPDLPSKIASITIRGQLFGADSNALGDPFGSGFIAEQIGAMKIGGTSVALNPGRNNDNLTADDPRLTFGFFRDVVVREIA